MDFSQVNGRFVKDYLERRPDVGVLQVTGKRRSIPLPNDHVNMDRGLSGWRKSHVTDHGCHLHLFLYGIANIVLLIPIEIAERDIGERTDASELSR